MTHAWLIKFLKLLRSRHFGLKRPRLLGVLPQMSSADVHSRHFKMSGHNDLHITALSGVTGEQPGAKLLLWIGLMGIRIAQAAAPLRSHKRRKSLEWNWAGLLNFTLCMFAALQITRQQDYIPLGQFLGPFWRCARDLNRLLIILSPRTELSWQLMVWG